MFNINLKHPAFTEKQYNCPVIQTHSSLYPLSGIWQELLGPHHGGISSQKVALNGAFDNLVKYKELSIQFGTF